MCGKRKTWENRKFNRSLSELDQVFEFLEEFFMGLELDEKILYEINLCVEELFTNMVRHNEEGESSIKIGLKRNDDNMLIQLSDREKTPFDITKTDDVDFDDYIENRRVGGLGIELVKKMMDHIDFNHHRGVSTITLTKNISGKTNVEN